MRRSLATIALVLGLSAPALAGTGDDRAAVAGVGPPDAAAALRLAQLAEPQSSATGDARVAIDFGTYFALVIGNQDYKNLADLPSARDDADDIAEVLTERFGFRVELLLDASRYEIISALAALRRELEETDNLLIYYAGHGHLDIESEEGYWLPVDAEPDSSVNWVSNSTLNGLIRAVRAKHVIVIADSTYSGRLTRNVDADLMTGTEQDAWIVRMAMRRSRTAMTSGSAKPVPHPIAAPMYLIAYASVVTGQSASAIKPLNHLAAADPALADVHNALALALFTADPNDHALALEHADAALALAPDLPQFAVTRVLTDRKQWKIAADGTARLTAAAARNLTEAANVLVTMRSNARKLGKLLSAIEQSGGDAEYPFVLPGYTTLIKNPELGFTRPSDKAIGTAQKAIEQKIFALRQRMIASQGGTAN